MSEDISQGLYWAGHLLVFATGPPSRCEDGVDGIRAINRIREICRGVCHRRGTVLLNTLFRLTAEFLVLSPRCSSDDHERFKADALAGSGWFHVGNRQTCCTPVLDELHEPFVRGH